MKLVLFTQHFAPHFEGGTETVVRAQARELLRRGHEVRIVSGTDRARAEVDVEEAEVDGFRVSFVPRFPEEDYALLVERQRVRELLRTLAEGADVAHVHHWSTLHYALVRDLAASCPVVVTLHDLYTTCPRFFRHPTVEVGSCPERGDFEPCTRCVAPVLTWLSPEAIHADLVRRSSENQAELDAAARVVFPSRAQADHVRAFLDVAEERLAIVHHGLCQPLERVPYTPWDGAGPLRVLFLGHRSELKGLGDLVRGLARLSVEEQRRVQLLLLGDEVEEGFDRALAAESPDLQLEFLGEYDLAHLGGILTRAGGAHLAALPSRAHESYGLVIDEALALGLPVWTSDRGAPRERIGRAGRVMPAEDSAAWTLAFHGLFGAPDVLEEERRAVPPALRTAADAALELEGLYAELLAKTP